MAGEEKKKGEAQYRDAIELMRHLGPQKLGLMSGWAYYDDPKRLTFTLARYKFVAKMFDGQDHVLEVGCSDAFATRIVAQAVNKITATDFDADFIKSAREIMSPRWPISFKTHDLLEGPIEGEFTAAYCLDVLEHIPAEKEDLFLRNMISSVINDGVIIIGMPSLQSQAYASAHSREGHVNCKSQPQLKELMRRYFHNVFMFGMNDETVHTGYHAMSHYILALCCGKKSGIKVD